MHIPLLVREIPVRCTCKIYVSALNQRPHKTIKKLILKFQSQQSTSASAIIIILLYRILKYQSQHRFCSIAKTIGKSFIIINSVNCRFQRYIFPREPIACFFFHVLVLQNLGRISFNKQLQNVGSFLTIGSLPGSAFDSNTVFFWLILWLCVQLLWLIR